MLQRSFIPENNLLEPDVSALTAYWEDLNLPALDFTMKGAGTATNTMLQSAMRIIAAQQERIAALENLALLDELTQLPNRRSFLSALNRELGAAARDETAQGVIILFDLDSFKTINDTYGHVAGDAYLKAFAAKLAGLIRASDLAARLGGDEFAVLLPRVMPSIGQERAHTLCRQMNMARMSWGSETLPLKASFGAVSYTGEDDPNTLIAKADAELYRHKMARK